MIFEAVCEAGHDFDYVGAVGQYREVPDCPFCGSLSRRAIRTAPRGIVAGDIPAFKSTVDGSLITSRRELAEHNRRNGVVNLGEGYSEEQIKSGAIGQRKTTDTKDTAGDLQAAIQAVKSGYKPQVQVDE